MEDIQFSSFQPYLMSYFVLMSTFFFILIVFQAQQTLQNIQHNHINPPSMKPKGLYQIHALIGRCHLHNKKKSLYSICLKMGTKAIANTQYKIPTDDQINFNTQLILKIDKTLFESGGKVLVTLMQLSLIVTIQTQDKEKKIIGTVLANYKQKGLQTLKVAQCSCKDKGLQVNVQFEVVNLQVHNNNNLHNNKFQSPNNSEMKEFKKALTISREKQLLKSSRTKPSLTAKSPIQKTQSKLNKLKLQSRLKQQLSPDLSCLTTKISPHGPKSMQESKQIIADLRNKILELENEIKKGLNYQKSARKQINVLQNEVEILRKQNNCLLQILGFEEEKSSAALEYITYLTQKINQNDLFDNHFHQYFDLIQSIKNVNAQNLNDIKSSGCKEELKSQISVCNVQPIQEKTENSEQTAQKLMEEVEDYKNSIVVLRTKITDLEQTSTERTNTISQISKKITEFEEQNAVLSSKNEKQQKLIDEYQKQLSSLKIEYSKLQSQNKSLQKNVLEATNNYDKSRKELKEVLQNFELALKDNKELQETILNLEERIQQLQQQKQHLEQIFNQKLQQIRKLQEQKLMTPPQSQIMMRKTRFCEGQQIGNIINEMNTMNTQSSPYKESTPSKDMLQWGSQKNTAKQSESESERFMVRNKSESLLKDLQQSDAEQSLRQDEMNNVYSESQQKDKKETHTSGFEQSKVKKIMIREHKKEVQKYNYEFDIDSLNYFNNCEQNHEIMETSGDHQNNLSQNDIEPISLRH